MNIKHILTKPRNKSNKGVILIPGISGKPLSNKYNFLAKELQKNNFYFLRFNIWESPSDLEKKTLNKIYRDIKKAIDYMKKIGCEEISLIGKSFGGGILLSKKFVGIKKLILLAPAINYASESNIEKIKNKELSKIKNIFDIKIDKNNLKKLDLEILIIHGDKDEIVPIENSRKIIKDIENGKLETIKNANHSYDKKEKELVKYYQEFLIKHTQKAYKRI